MKIQGKIHPLMAAVSVIVLIACAGCSPPPEPDRINITQALSDTIGTACYDRADRPADIRFPKDAGPHDTFQTEWWYYTGNLATPRGRTFGYQLTFFRQALACDPVKGDSKWRTRQLYFAHFAVTDVAADAFVSEFRMNRQSLGIAGAESRPFSVWIDNWRAGQTHDRLVLTAKGEKIAIRLDLFEEKPVILQGRNGLSRKGKAQSNASYYYSMPRLRTEGVLEIGPDTYPVAGTSWFDHEWSTSALDTDVAGWDWFSVHLDDGQDLMVCQIRKADGTPSGYSFGSLSFPDGTHDILSPDDFSIQATGTWTSPATGRKYPGRWQIRLPRYGLELAADPLVKNQEHTHMFAYWEGAVQFQGNGVKGLGYVELTGY